MLSEPPSEDLSSIVGGLHGGKYQFGAGGAQSFVGAGFADSLATANAAQVDIEGSGVSAEEAPKWAQVLMPQPLQVAGTVSFSAGHDEANVRVQNTYRTWEPWVAAVVTVDGSEPAAPNFSVAPTSGTLAPRGGANNVCDASKPYHDGVVLGVRCTAPPAVDHAEQQFLVVKTEEEQWTFALSW